MWTIGVYPFLIEVVFELTFISFGLGVCANAFNKGRGFGLLMLLILVVVAAGMHWGLSYGSHVLNTANVGNGIILRLLD